MKLLHTSDWHLGARLGEQDRLPEQGQFLDWLLGALREERPDALVISGDIYDTRTPSNAAVQLFCDFLCRLRAERLCRRVVAVAGNHDSAAVLRATENILDLIDITVVSEPDLDHPASLAVVVPDDSGAPGLVVGAVPFLSGAGFRRPPAPDEAQGPEARDAGGAADPATAFVREVFRECLEKGAGCPVVLTGHCAVSGARLSDDQSERGRDARQIGGLDLVSSAALPPADYVALGHLHLPQRVGAADSRVYYSGAPLAMSFDEAEQGPKSVVVAEFGPRHGDGVAVRTLKVLDFLPVLTLEGQPDDIRKALAGLVATGRPALVRLRVTAYQGELALFWNETDELVRDTPLRVLVRDAPLPPDEAQGLPAIVRQGRLRNHQPLDVARARLDDLALSEEERALYLGMLTPLMEPSDEP